MTHEFTLLLEGPDVLSEEVFAELDTSCHDAVFGRCGGTQFAEFGREGSSRESAMARAIRDIEGAVPGLCVVAVEPRVAARLDEADPLD